MRVQKSDSVDEGQIFRVSGAISKCSLDILEYLNLSNEELKEKLNRFQCDLESELCDILKNVIELNEQKCFYQDLYRSAPEPYIVLDEYGDILHANKSFCKLFGIYNTNISNLHFNRFIMPSFTQIVKTNACALSSEDTTAVSVTVNNGADNISALMLCNTLNLKDKRYICAAFTNLQAYETKDHQDNRNFDGLTGLYNRQYFEHIIDSIDTTDNLPLTAVAVNLDGLRVINDNFGFANGDRVIKNVAKAIKEESRDKDYVFRMGGDDILIIMPSTLLVTAESILEGVDKKLKNITIQNEHISVSVGISSKYIPSQKIDKTIKKAEDNMFCNKMVNGNSLRSSAVDILIKFLYEKSAAIQGHSSRVAALCKRLGELLGLPESDLNILERMGMLHDIGKIGIPDSTINKKASLSELEWEQIRSHPETGYRILRCVNGMDSLAENIYCHHERWDGRGYPRGIKGNDIPLLARIVTVCDSYDAMSSDRPYRKALGRDQIINEFFVNSGKQFDPQLAKLFVEEFLKKE